MIAFGTRPRYRHGQRSSHKITVLLLLPVDTQFEIPCFSEILSVVSDAGCSDEGSGSNPKTKRKLDDAGASEINRLYPESRRKDEKERPISEFTPLAGGGWRKRVAERGRNWSDVTRARREECRKGGLNSPKTRWWKKKRDGRPLNTAQSVLPQNWSGTDPNHTVTCMVLEAAVTIYVKLAPCRYEFRGTRLDTLIRLRICILRCEEVLGPVDSRDVIYTKTRLRTPSTDQSSRRPPHRKKCTRTANCFINRHPGTGVCIQVSSRTIQRRLAEGHLGSRCPLRVLPLTPTQRRLRLKWYRARGNWTAAEWNQVVFSDESRFNLSSDDNRVRVWRPRREHLNSAFALQRHTAPTAGVMVWGAIAYNTRSPLDLVLISGTMTAQRYVHHILQPHMLPLMQRLP
ncbi:transposable element Tcb1 transposase [Trichonephila clavipes]|nr:transposable element Tcb1 transposase [Trichonephila clavipes]